MKIKLYIVGLSLAIFCLSACTKKETKKDLNLYLDITDEWQSRSYFSVKDYKRTSIDYGNQISGDMVVDGSDIYYPAYNGYFKNGVLVPLTQADGIQAIYVKDGDVYAAGNRTPYGVTYWKNGQMLKLDPDSTDYAMWPNQIVVNEYGIFIAGAYRDGNNNIEEIAYWKNGVLHRLPNGQYGARFAGMAVSGSDVYIAGQSQEENAGVGVYWKNTEKRYLYNYDHTRPSFLTSIRTNKGDVYITGGGNNGPLYWKNEAPVGNSGTSNTPTDIFVDKDKIYVAGTFMLPYSSGPVYSVTLWKNGDFDTVSNGIARKFAAGQ